MGSQKVGHDLLTKTTTNKNKHMAPTYSRPPLRPGISSPTLVAGHATGKAFFCALKKKKEGGGVEVVTLVVNFFSFYLFIYLLLYNIVKLNKIKFKKIN